MNFQLASDFEVSQLLTTCIFVDTVGFEPNLPDCKSRAFAIYATDPFLKQPRPPFQRFRMLST